jgi:hypothetical protein
MIAVVCLSWVMPLPPLQRASGQSDAGFVTLKTLGGQVTAIGSLSGTTPVIVVATRNAGLYAMTGTNGVFRKLPAQLDLMTVTTIAVIEPERWLVGTDGDGLWLVRGGGTAFEPVTTLDCSRVARIIQDPRDADALFIASLCTGLHYSTDRGVTWRNVGRGIKSFQVSDVVRLDDDRIAVATQDDGVFVSMNNGALYAKVACPIVRVSSLAWSDTSKTLYAAGGTAVAVTADAGLHWKSLPSPGAVTGVVATPSGVLLAGVSAKGLLRWDSAANAWRDTAQGAGVTSVTALTLESGFLTMGSASGAIVRADLAKPVAAVSPSAVELGTIPLNQSGHTAVTVVNIGKGTLTWRVENVPAYVTATPSTGGSAPAVIDFGVEGDSLNKGPYQAIVKLVTTGGDFIIPVRFTIGDQASVSIMLTVGGKDAMVGGRSVILDAAPFIDKGSGRTMVPMRFIGEAFGATVTWNAPTRRVFVETRGTANHVPLLMVMTIASKTAVVNGKAMTLDVAPVIVASRTFVPLRVISETLGAAVTWHADTRAVSIEYLP